MASANKQAVERINESFARNDVDGFLASCAGEVTWTMVGERPLHGKDAIRDFMKSAPSEAPQFTVEQMIADGDFVACYGNMTMQDKGERVPYSFCDVYRFRDGKVIELRSYVVKTAAAAPSAGPAAV